MFFSRAPPSASVIILRQALGDSAALDTWLKVNDLEDLRPFMEWPR